MPKKKEEIPFTFDDSNSEHVFTDILQVVMTGDAVTLDIGIRSKKEGNPSKVSHSVHMTVPHFLRVTEVFKDLADKISEQIESQTK
tara:strand:- start:79 stop:336 length:258 start_codon:yes stop_codon:yes gene_type:complete